MLGRTSDLWLRGRYAATCSTLTVTSHDAEWHFLLEGPPDTPYAGGWYIGKLRFPVSASAAAHLDNMHVCKYSAENMVVARVSFQASCNHDADSQWPLCHRHPPVPLHE